jgi:hypothetical protein
MSEENRKIVIVVGAGASCDFYPEKFSFPVGEALIKMICNKEEIASFFWNEICKSFKKVVFEKIKTTGQANFHNIFCDFLIDRDVAKDIIKLNFSRIADEFSSYLGKNFDKLKNLINFNVDSYSVRKTLYELYIDINANEECLFYKIIIANCNSRHIQISSLVNYYQPFSIDELLDSVKTKKIDVLEPLKIKKEDLKAILKSDEEDSKKLEEQFRNELINAGKTLIAMFLLRSEKRDLFDNPNPQNDTKIWYRHIRNLIINSGKDSTEIKKQIQNLTIISFNYDRSLDYYLHTRLSDYYGEIKERVFYPYGKLAVDNWDRKDYGKFNKDGKFNPYNDDELREIEELGQGLRVIGELDEDLSKKYFNLENKNLTKVNEFKKEIGNFEEYCRGIVGNNEPSKILNLDIDKLEELKKSEKDDKIKDEINFILEKYKTLLALHESHKIYFLGFAFHQQNCELLQLKNLLTLKVDQRDVYYTNFDESKSINKMVNEIFIIGKEPWKLTLHDSKRKGVYDALMHDFKLGL